MFTEKQLSQRIAQMAFESDPDKLVKWLVLVSNGKVTYKDEVIFIEPLNGTNLGFLFNSDPITKAVMIASAIAGPSVWAKAFPSLLKEVQNLWKTRTKNKYLNNNFGVR